MDYEFRVTGPGVSSVVRSITEPQYDFWSGESMDQAYEYLTGCSSNSSAEEVPEEGRFKADFAADCPLSIIKLDGDNLARIIQRGGDEGLAGVA